MNTGHSTPDTRNEILVVADNAPHLAAILTDAGYDVVVAPADERALRFLDRGKSALVLLDGNAGLCRRIRDVSDIPVIVMIDQGQPETRLLSLRQGACDTVGKPILAEELLARIAPYIALAQLRQSRQDVSEQLERRLAEERRILAAMDLAGDGISIINTDDTIEYANSAMMQTLGIPHVQDLIGLPVEEISGGSSSVFKAEEIQAARQSAKRNGQWSGELSLHLPGQKRSKRLWTHIRALPDGGRILVINDVTDARQREEEQHRLEQQLEQARRLEALGQLAANVAHDFNNLLGAILGFAQFIVEDTDEDSALNRYGTRILKAGHQAKSLIGEILAFSHRRESTLERVEMSSLIQENTGVLKAIVAPTTSLDIQIDTEEMVIAGQGSQIMQLLVNLVGNASEALVGASGTVGVYAHSVEPIDIPPMPHAVPSNGEAPSASSSRIWTDEREIHHAAFGNLHSDIPHIRLSVTDSGNGIPLAVLSNIFQPFFTTKANSGGTGLGLAVVHDIVMGHRAGLLLSTAPGQGTRIDVYFPVSDIENLGEQDLQQILPVTHRGSILLVDDSTHFGNMLMTALFRLGYEISVCDNPLDAIGYVEEDSAAWDLVITDQIMPQMKGTEFVAAIKKLRPELPCIICTAIPNGLTDADIRQAGADGLASKPLDIGLFSSMVKDLITRRK
ncbi:MAG TPA: response regulator [Candidatus Sulfotelmatobacter sp.]|jgi:signal transduction histidine kinase/ActR/RegA family two-component response regulator|nr:response regulator [Candidatus Sulfotelmatobacter sp.]